MFATSTIEQHYHFGQTSDILYYEVLDMPLPELQGLRTLRVAFRHGTNNEVSHIVVKVCKLVCCQHTHLSL